MIGAPPPSTCINDVSCTEVLTASGCRSAPLTVQFQQRLHLTLFESTAGITTRLKNK